MNNISKIELKDMKLAIIVVVAGFWSKLITALHSVSGWVWGCILTLGAFLSPIKYLLLFIVIVTLIDMCLGIWIHRKNILSSKLRLTIFKLFFYLGTIALCFGMETLVGVAILYKIIFGLIGLTELISISSNALIINPNIKFVKLFKTLLNGEIAKKLDVSKEEVETILEDKKKKTVEK